MLIRLTTILTIAIVAFGCSEKKESASDEQEKKIEIQEVDTLSSAVPDSIIAAIALEDSLDKIYQDSMAIVLEVEQEMEIFKAIADSFIVAWNKRDSVTLNGFVHHHYGLFVAYQPGAYDTFEQKFAFGSDREWQDVFNMGLWMIDQKLDGELVFGDYPTYNCDSESWTSEGFFMTKEFDFNLSNIQEMMVEYELTHEDNKFATMLEAVDNHMEYAIYNTKANMGIIFTNIGGKWSILAIDAFEFCSA